MEEEFIAVDENGVVVDVVTLGPADGAPQNVTLVPKGKTDVGIGWTQDEETGVFNPTPVEPRTQEMVDDL